MKNPFKLFHLLCFLQNLHMFIYNLTPSVRNYDENNLESESVSRFCSIFTIFFDILNLRMRELEMLMSTPQKKQTIFPVPKGLASDQTRSFRLVAFTFLSVNCEAFTFSSLLPGPQRRLAPLSAGNRRRECEKVLL